MKTRLIFRYEIPVLLQTQVPFKIKKHNLSTTHYKTSLTSYSMHVCIVQLTTACWPGERVLLHFAHFKQKECQSLPSEVLRSAVSEYVCVCVGTCMYLFVCMYIIIMYMYVVIVFVA